eukprot:GEMP01021556.1.p1 GENE.GEMP01021556.1~~GEMP01021556.1.p1  ORF type:complete len:319 (+),score=30.70 GEMP01021556.1:2-958(+)
METWRKWSIFLSIVGRVCLSLTFLGTIVCNVIAGIMMHKRLMVQISPNRVFSEIPFSCYGILLGFVTAYRAQAAILRLYDAKRLVVTIRLYVLELWNASQSRFLNEEFDLQEDDTIENIKKVFTNLHNEFMPFVMYMFRQLQISSENSGVEIRDWWDTRIREAMNKGVPIRDLPESFYHAGQACTGCEKMHLIYASLSYKIRRYLPDELPKLRKILKTYQEGLVQNIDCVCARGGISFWQRAIRCRLVRGSSWSPSGAGRQRRTHPSRDQAQLHRDARIRGPVAYDGAQAVRTRSDDKWRPSCDVRPERRQHPEDCRK